MTGLFQIFLCEDLNELYEAYFRDFQADGIDQPHKLFTGSWRTPIAAKYLGLSPEVLTSGSSFVLVKLVRDKVTKSISGDLRLKPEADQSLRSLQTGNTEAILEFVQHYGSHFLREISVGESIYQVFAITPEQFQKLQRIIGSGINNIGLQDWSSIYESYLAPWLVRETGEVKAASGDFDPNLIESVNRNPALLNRLEELSDKTVAVVGLNLSSLRSFVIDPQTQQFFDETINTHSSLFEVNV